MNAMTLDSPKAPAHPDTATLRFEPTRSAGAERPYRQLGRTHVPYVVLEAVRMPPPEPLSRLGGRAGSGWTSVSRSCVATPYVREKRKERAMSKLTLAAFIRGRGDRR